MLVALLQAIVSGLAVGSAYALIALASASPSRRPRR